MKTTKTDITAGEASDSAVREVTSGILTAWGASSLGMFLSSSFGCEWPAWRSFNPLILIGRQALAAAAFWGLPFVVANLVITWLLIFQGADRLRSAAILFSCSFIVGAGSFYDYAIQEFWADNSEYLVLMVITSTLLVIACWALWRIRRKENVAEQCNRP